MRSLSALVVALLACSPPEGGADRPPRRDERPPSPSADAAPTAAAGAPPCPGKSELAPGLVAERVLLPGRDAACLTLVRIDLARFRSIGLLYDARAVNSDRDNPKQGGFLAFDPVDPSSPPAVMTGRDCPGFDLAALRRRYRGLVRTTGCSTATAARSTGPIPRSTAPPASPSTPTAGSSSSTRASRWT